MSPRLARRAASLGVRPRVCTAPEASRKIFSCRISWITAAILSPPLTSTSGLAPWLSITIRFWISVESLNRPPTLLTMPSSFNSSSILSSSLRPRRGRRFAGQHRLDDGMQPPDRRVQGVVDHLIIVLAGPRHLPLGVGQALADRRLVLAVAGPQPPLQLLLRRGQQEDRKRLRALSPHLGRPLHVDDQYHAHAAL